MIKSFVHCDQPYVLSGGQRSFSVRLLTKALGGNPLENEWLTPKLWNLSFVRSQFKYNFLFLKCQPSTMFKENNQSQPQIVKIKINSGKSCTMKFLAPKIKIFAFASRAHTYTRTHVHARAYTFSIYINSNLLHIIYTCNHALNVLSPSIFDLRAPFAHLRSLRVRCTHYNFLFWFVYLTRFFF